MIQEVVKWFEERQMLLEMFVNYDMDGKFVSQWNTFSYLVRTLCSISRRLALMPTTEATAAAPIIGVSENLKYSDPKLNSASIRNVYLQALQEVVQMAKILMDASGIICSHDNRADDDDGCVGDDVGFYDDDEDSYDDDDFSRDGWDFNVYSFTFFYLIIIIIIIIIGHAYLMIQDDQFRDKSISTTGGWKEDERQDIQSLSQSSSSYSSSYSSSSLSSSSSSSSVPQPSSPRAAAAIAPAVSPPRPQHRRSHSSIKDRRAVHQQSEKLIGMIIMSSINLSVCIYRNILHHVYIYYYI